MSKNKRVASLLLLTSLDTFLSDCWALLAASVGAYGGYKMKEKGYALQNPITKEKNKRKTNP